MKRNACWLVALSVLLFSCQNNRKPQQENLYEMDPDTDIASAVHEVIYSLYLPTDISRLFEETGANFDPAILVSLDDIPRYEKPEQIALLLGALGVDLSYCKLFNRTKETSDYYNQIEILGDKLDLPNEIFQTASRDMDRYFDDPDSLTIVINEIYRKADSYFHSHMQESLASIALLGGWIEAMNIGVNIYRTYDHIDMRNRILQQKFALISLSGLLSNYQETLDVRGYILLLNKLKEEYDKVEILYNTEGFAIDTKEKKLQMSSADIRYDPETLQNICRLIGQIRLELLK